MQRKELNELCERLASEDYSDLSDYDLTAFLMMCTKYMPHLLELNRIVRLLPWGYTAALPWCIEAFPQLKACLDKLDGLDKEDK